MAAITITQLENAALDVAHIAELATSSELTATDRLGNTKNTMAGALAEYPNAYANAAAAAASAALAAAERTEAEAAQTAAEAARDAAIAGAFATWPTTAAGIGSGVQGVASLVGGSGGTNGTFALAFASGTQVIEPAGNFVVAGGIVTQVTITYAGYYSAGTPTLSFAASAGLTGASATAVMAANTAVNEYFCVPSAVAGEAAIVYRNLAGVATEIIRTPSIVGVLAMDSFHARATATAAEAAAMVRVKKLELFGADPTKFYSLKYLFWKDSGTRINITVVQHTDDAGTGAVDVCSYSISTTAYTGPVELTMAAVGGSGITGTVVIDFTDPTAMTVNSPSSSAAMYQRRAINPKCIVNGTARTANLNVVIHAALNTNSTLTTGLKLPFSDEMDTDYLRKVVKGIWLYGVDKTHDYILSVFDITDLGATCRLRATIHDLTLAADACAFSLTNSSADLATFIPTIPTSIKLTDATVTPKTQIYAVLDLDTSDAITGAGNITSTTMAQAGIHVASLYPAELTADYLDRDHWHEVIPVGAGQTYTTLRTAVESLYVGVGDARCNRSHYHHRILIDLVDDATYDATYLTVPEFVEVRGNGVGRTFIEKENEDTDALLEAHYDTKFRDLTIISDTLVEYCIHSDNSNVKSIGGVAQNRRLSQSFKRMVLRGGATQNGWLFGCGISSGQTILMDDVVLEHLNPSVSQAALGVHNTGPTISVPDVPLSYKPPLLDLRRVRSPDSTTVALYLQSLGAGAVARCVLGNCSFSLVQQAVASGELDTDLAASRYEWEIGGVYSGPILQSDADMLVLGTTAGQTPTGTAAALIFGTTDELGRGDKWIKTGTTKSLGARLGDCSSVNKTLTIGGQTHTFNADHTAQSNATLIAAINASLTTYPVAEVNIQYEIYPDTGYTRRMLNSTGATIAAGKFVKRTGANTIALADGTDDIYGFVYRSILNGLAGNVVVSKRIHGAYITGAAGDGKFGVTAGLLDYGAATKVGYVCASIVNLYP
jgi:hypothetical protein